MEKAVAETEAERAPLAEAIAEAMVPVRPRNLDQAGYAIRRQRGSGNREHSTPLRKLRDVPP